jgi:hypothetical protein
MRIPRITLVQLMVVVGLLAVDLWALASIPDDGWAALSLCILAWLPMANVVFVSWLLWMTQRQMSIPAHDFLGGFWVVGSAVTNAMLILIVLFTQAGLNQMWEVDLALKSLRQATRFDADFFADLVRMAFVAAFFTIPQLLLAVVGGRANVCRQQRLRSEKAEES